MSCSWVQQEQYLDFSDACFVVNTGVTNTAIYPVENDF
jgi:hypothetical protein